MILWVGASLVGLIALIADGVCDPSDIATALLRAMAVTAVVVAGGSLAYARVNFEWQATLIERKIEDREVDGSDELGKLPEEMRGWPNSAELAWAIGLKAIILAAFTFLGCVWGHSDGSPGATGAPGAGSGGGSPAVRRHDSPYLNLTHTRHSLRLIHRNA